MIGVGGLRSDSDRRPSAGSHQSEVAEMVQQKRFREDLYFPLERGDAGVAAIAGGGGDILMLAGHFLDDFCRRARRKMPNSLPRPASAPETKHHWRQRSRVTKPDGAAGLSYPWRSDKAEDLAFILSPRGPSAMHL